MAVASTSTACESFTGRACFRQQQSVLFQHDNWQKISAGGSEYPTFVLPAGSKSRPVLEQESCSCKQITDFYSTFGEQMKESASVCTDHLHNSSKYVDKGKS